MTEHLTAGTVTKISQFSCSCKFVDLCRDSNLNKICGYCAAWIIKYQVRIFFSIKMEDFTKFLYWISFMCLLCTDLLWMVLKIHCLSFIYKPQLIHKMLSLPIEETAVIFGWVLSKNLFTMNMKPSNWQ